MIIFYLFFSVGLLYIYIYILLQLPVGYDISPLKRVKLKSLTTSSPPLKRVKFKILTTSRKASG